MALALISGEHLQKVNDIEAALATPGHRLRFIPWLEAGYEKARALGRNRSIARYLVVYLAAKLIFLWCNLQVGSTVFRVSMSLRLGIVLPLTIAAVYVLVHPFPSWVKGLAAFAPLTVETGLVMLLGRLSGSAVSDRYVFAAGVGIFAQTLLMPAPFWYSVRGLAVNLALFCGMGLAVWPGHLGARISSDYLVFVVVFSLPALYERHSRERSERRDFLHSELNRLRVEDILSMNEYLNRISALDPLTGIFNRRHLDAALARLCKVAYTRGRWIGVLMFDIDRFKDVNDTAGHQHGDLCLKEVAQLLQSSVRVGLDTVARYGGEEFCAILPDADEEQAAAIGERARKSIEDAALPGVPGSVLTVSAGAAAIRGKIGSRFTPYELVARADQALLAAKVAGRNRVISSGQCTAREMAPTHSPGNPQLEPIPQVAEGI